MDEEECHHHITKIGSTPAPKLMVVCGLLGAIVSAATYLIANRSQKETVNLINMMLSGGPTEPQDDI